MIFSYSYFSVYQPCVCEISQLMNNPQSLSETSSIEAIFNKKVKNSENMDQAATLLILNKILNSYKNPIFTSYISKKQYPV